jgi:hypothetical protein
MQLVYGHAWHHDCLAFADASTAATEADELTAIVTAPTFGAAAAVPAVHISNPAADTVEDGGADPDEPMDIFRCYGVEDGDWPPMVTSRALHLLPQAIQQEYGRRVVTNFNGDYLDVPLDMESSIVQALSRLGFDLTRDDNLINVLDGRTFNPMSYDDPNQMATWPVPQK